MSSAPFYSCGVRPAPRAGATRVAGALARGMDIPASMPIGGPTADRYFPPGEPEIGEWAYNADFVRAQRSVAAHVEPELLSPLDHARFFPGGHGRTQSRAEQHGRSVGLRNMLRAHNREIHRIMDNHEPQWMPRSDWAGVPTRELEARTMLPTVQGA